MSFNGIDRHIISGRRNKAALIWQGEREMDVRCFTCQMLYAEVCRVAHAPSSLRVRKGDRVALYMPMIPELVIAMLACARLGAAHTAIFSGYAAGGVRSRMQGVKAKVVISRPTGWCVPAASSHSRPIWTPFWKRAPRWAHVVGSHAGIGDVKMQPKRDIWWHDRIEVFPCEQTDANDPLFLLHTSDSTGKPAGILHSTGGYLTTCAAHTTQWIFDMRNDDVC